ncbi:DUF6427 family protein [Faecalibacter rhinopitheci]|uniref:Uncharacterized protein n=1 Tax=Faecalibacter rhinopitheci TaxID=2779678 RepID=A0A8J7KDT7_9FLAO|nr:DUF6427 family protein [Faecalibacter rhinopitheci]MBF0597706.1 hypothetical protein [Faecalibacter rhinopitheci]MBQ0147264.1 hypothetical protein [Candidatus Onthonaster equi]
MLVNLLAKRNFFIQIFIIILFSILGATNFNSIYLSNLEIIGLSLSFLTIGYVVYIDSDNELISKSSYTTWFYILWMMPFMVQLLDYKMAGSLLLVTYITSKLIYFETDQSKTFEAFDIGVFLGFTILLNPPLFILGLVVFTYFLTLKGIDSSIIILAILGLLVPLLVFVQISYLLDFNFLIDYYQKALSFNFFEFDIKQIFLVPIVIFAIVAFANFLINANKESVHVKRVFLLLHLMLISLILICVLYGGAEIKFLCFFGILFMIIFTKYFANKKPHMNWLKETILWSYLVCMLFYNFYDRIPRIYSLITEVSF